VELPPKVLLQSSEFQDKYSDKSPPSELTLVSSIEQKDKWQTPINVRLLTTDNSCGPLTDDLQKYDLSPQPNESPSNNQDTDNLIGICKSDYTFNKGSVNSTPGRVSRVDKSGQVEV
jgi:hypothetical protein